MRRSVPPAFLTLASLHTAALVLCFVAALTDLFPAVAAGTVFGLVGAAAAVWSARRPGLPVLSRWAWGAVAAGYVALALRSDVAFAVALLAASHLFPLVPTAPRRRWRGVLDASTVLVGGAMVLWYVVAGPYADPSGTSPVAGAPGASALDDPSLLPILLSAVLDLALLFTIVRVLLRGAVGITQGGLRFMAAGVLLHFIGALVAGSLLAGAPSTNSASTGSASTSSPSTDAPSTGSPSTGSVTAGSPSAGLALSDSDVTSPGLSASTLMDAVLSRSMLTESTSRGSMLMGSGFSASMLSGWLVAFWVGAAALMAAGAVAQSRAVGGAPAEGRAFLNRYLHFGAVAVAHGLMVVAAVRSGTFFPWGGLVVGGSLLCLAVLLRQALVQRESDERAVTDSLTGLANRSRVRAWSNRALTRGARSGRHSAILVIDMNGFKEVNDTLGHHYGDLVLVAFADVLRQCVPAPGMPARLGGDEFAAVLPDLEFPEEAYEVAGRLAATLAPMVIGGQLITLAASIGVAVSGPGELTHDQLVHRADLAMYQAKKRGPQTRWAAWQESFEERDLPTVA